VEEAAIRAAIVAAGARLGARGLVAAAEGNLSVRLSSDALLVTPSGRRKDELAPGELVVVPLERPGSGDAADAAGNRPTSDVAIHRAIMRRRPDVTAIAHAHLPASMALTLAGERPDPLALPETALFLPVLPVVAFGAMGSEELAARIAAAFGEGDPQPGAAILERHGAVAVGAGSPDAALVEAVDRLELVEVLCRVWRDALLVRAARGAVRPDEPAR
jgi:L-fuculose-phosphate aldolase